MCIFSNLYTKFHWQCKCNYMYFNKVFLKFNFVKLDLLVHKHIFIHLFTIKNQIYKIFSIYTVKLLKKIMRVRGRNIILFKNMKSYLKKP